MSTVPRIWAKKLGAQSKLFAFERGGKTGFIDETGRVVVRAVLPGDIHEVGDFAEGLVRVGDRFFDERGLEAFSVAGYASDFSGGLANVYLIGEGQAFVGRDGKERFRVGASWARGFSEGMAAFQARGKKGIREFEPGKFTYRDFPGLWGFLDETGGMAIGEAFADVGAFQGGLARAVVDGYCHVLSPEGDREGSPTTGVATSCGGAPADAVKACPVGFIDRTGRFAIGAEFAAARDFAEGVAAVMVGGRWGFVDRAGKMVIAAEFERAHSFSEGLAAVMVTGKWGFVDKGGRMVIAAEMKEEPWDFSEGRAVVGGVGQLSYIDKRGRVALAGPYLEATAFVQGLAAVRVSEEEVAYITPAGRVVFRYRPKF
jgi:hypothetical protein